MTRAEVQSSLELLANAAAGCNAELVTMLDWDIMGAIDARDARIAELEAMTNPYEQGYSDGFGTGWQDAREAAAVEVEGAGLATVVVNRIRALEPTKEETK
jgi:hypothetical protein